MSFGGILFAAIICDIGGWPSRSTAASSGADQKQKGTKEFRQKHSSTKRTEVTKNGRHLHDQPMLKLDHLTSATPPGVRTANRHLFVSFVDFVETKMVSHERAHHFTMTPESEQLRKTSEVFETSEVS